MIPYKQTQEDDISKREIDCAKLPMIPSAPTKGRRRNQQPTENRQGQVLSLVKELCERIG